jgi:hypothetical protein
MKEEHEVNLPAIILSIFGLITLSFGVYVFFALHGTDYTSVYMNRTLEKAGGSIYNLTSGNMSTGDFLGSITKTASESFEIEIIKNLLVEIKAYNLHEIPLTKNTPKIEIFLDDNVYNAEIISGEIYVKKGEINTEDIIIRTSLDEISKISSGEKNIQESLTSGNIKIEIISDKSTLLLKGYGSLLGEYTGFSY